MNNDMKELNEAINDCFRTANELCKEYCSMRRPHEFSPHCKHIAKTKQMMEWLIELKERRLDDDKRPKGYRDYSRDYRIEHAAVGHYGASHQINIAIEEMSELIKELCKCKRDVGEGNVCEAENIDRIREEIADAQIMLDQMAIIFGEEKVGDWKDHKLMRLLNRMATGREAEE